MPCPLWRRSRVPGGRVSWRVQRRQCGGSASESTVSSIPSLTPLGGLSSYRSRVDGRVKRIASEDDSRVPGRRPVPGPSSVTLSLPAGRQAKRRVSTNQILRFAQNDKLRALGLRQGRIRPDGRPSGRLRRRSPAFTTWPAAAEAGSAGPLNNDPDAQASAWAGGDGCGAGLKPGLQRH